MGKISPAKKAEFAEKSKELKGHIDELNKKIQEIILGFLDIEQEILYTDEFVNPSLAGLWDYRDKINPKKVIDDPHFKCLEYTQVFSSKHGFIPNLSIIDLLFNLGPGSSEYLRSSVM